MPERRWRVVWSEQASVDLVEVVSFVAGRSPANARRLLLRLQTKAGALEHSPQRGRVVPELADGGVRAWRELTVAPYRIVYRITEREVRVGALLDGRRDLTDLLLERLTRAD